MTGEGERPTWRLLSPVTAEIPAGPVVLEDRSRAVLLVLLTHPGEAVSADRLAYLIWGDELPKTARNSISRFVSNLRRALGDYGDRIETVSGGYCVRLEPGDLDVDRATDALHLASKMAPDDAQGALRTTAEGLALFAGDGNPALDDIRGSAPIRRRHAELQIALMELRAELRLQLGHKDELIVELEAAIAAHPHHEKFWSQLMVALARAGRRADALRAFQRLAAELADIGLEPSASVRELEAEVAASPEPAALGRDDDSSVAPPLRRAHYGLAEPRTSLVGREEETKQVIGLLADARLVTLIGLGGSGKTRLALAAARELEAGGETVHRLGLRPMTDGSMLVPALAEAVGVGAGGGRGVAALADLIESIRRERFLLLIDNCEHLSDAVATVVDSLLDEVPGARVLATSRQRIGLEGEHRYRVAPLETPPPDGVSSTTSAVALFLDRARAHAPHLSANADALLDIGAVCRALSGLPIAIELAAAQMAYIGPAELLANLHRPMGPATLERASPRSRLASIMEWAWDALTPEEQTLLARLSVFDDTWSIHAAEVVGGGPLDGALAGLIDKSVVSPIPTTAGTRYGMLEAVRDHARAALDSREETGATRDRLADCMVELTGGSGIAELSASADLMDELEPDHDNILAALTHLRQEGRTEELLWLAVRSAGMWIHRGFPGEVARWLEPLADAPEVGDEARSAAAAVLMDAASAFGDAANVARWGVQCLELADGAHHDWVPHVAGVVSILSMVFDLPMSSDELYELSVGSARGTASEAVNRASAEMWRGHVDFASREYESAVQRFRAARAHSDVRGRILLLSEVGEGLALHLLGRLDPSQHEAAAGVAAGWRSHADTDEWHYLVEVARAIIDGGAGDVTGATERLTETVESLPAAGVWSRADDYQMAFGLLADMRGDTELASQLLDSLSPGSPLLVATLIEHVAVRLDRHGAEGWTLTTVEIIGQALAADRELPGGRAEALPDMVGWWVRGYGTV